MNSILNGSLGAVALREAEASRHDADPHEGEGLLEGASRDAANSVPRPGSCVRLAELRAGRRGRLCAHHQAALSARLRDLGFVPGTPLEVVRTAPLGDPIEVGIRGYRLCLRRADIRNVCVVPEP